MFPQTAAPLRTLLKGEERRVSETVFNCLKAEAGRLAPRLKVLFPASSGILTIEDLHRIYVESCGISSAVRGVVAASEHPGFSMKHIPLSFGGLFVFESGGWAELLWDCGYRLDKNADGTPNIFSDMGLGGKIIRSSKRSSTEASFFPLDWKEAQEAAAKKAEIFRMESSDEGRVYRRRGLMGDLTFSLDPESRSFITSHNSLLEPGSSQSIHYLKRIQYEADALLYAGCLTMNGKSKAWSYPMQARLVPPANHDYSLKAAVSQFLYFPRVVLEIRGYSLSYDHIRYEQLFPFVEEARRCLSDPAFSRRFDGFLIAARDGENAVMFTRIDGGSPVRVTLDLKNEADLDLEWRVKMYWSPKEGHDPEKVVYDCISVSKGNAEIVEDYIRAKSHQGRRIFETQ